MALSKKEFRDKCREDSSLVELWTSLAQAALSSRQALTRLAEVKMELNRIKGEAEVKNTEFLDALKLLAKAARDKGLEMPEMGVDEICNLYA